MRPASSVSSLILALAVGCGPDKSQTDSPQRAVADTLTASAAVSEVTAESRATDIAFGVPLGIAVHSVPGADTTPEVRSRLMLPDTVLEIRIRDARVLTALPTEGGGYWLLISGTECRFCDAPETVWAFRTTPNPITALEHAFVFPGEFLAFVDDDPDGDDELKPTFRSRLFVGRCLAEPESVAVWIEERLRPESARRHEIRILRAMPQLRDTVVSWSPELAGQIEERARGANCREIPPRDQVIL
jgi:hypothetical protein